MTYPATDTTTGSSIDNSIDIEPDFTVTVSIPFNNTNTNNYYDNNTNNVLYTIAYGSCHKTKYYDKTVWTTIQNESTSNNLISFLWIGDTIYPPNRSIASLQQVYNEYYSTLYNTAIGYNTFVQYMYSLVVPITSVSSISSQQQIQDSTTTTRSNSKVSVQVHPKISKNQNQQQEQDDKENDNNSNNRIPPIFGTWDDHDYGGNDYGNEMIQKKERLQLFWNFLHPSLKTILENPSVQQVQQQQQQHVPFEEQIQQEQEEHSHHQQHLLNREGVYYSVQYKMNNTNDNSNNIHIDNNNDVDNNNNNITIRVLFLDTRYHRSQHCLPSVTGKIPLGAGVSCLFRWITAGGIIPNKYCTTKQKQYNSTILGNDQWIWLQNQLVSYQQNQQNPDDLLVIVSSIQVVTTNPTVESWGHYPKERNKLLQLLVHHQQLLQQPIIILSGDVHYGEILDPMNFIKQYNTQHNVQNQNHNQKMTQINSIPNYPFLEITSSALTHDCTHGVYGFLCQPLLQTFFKHRYYNENTNNNNNNENDSNNNKFYYIGRNYGTISIYNNHTFQLNIRNVINGQSVISTGILPLRRRLLLQQQQNQTTSNNWTQDDIVNSIYPCIDGHLQQPFIIIVIVTVLIAFIVLIRYYKMSTLTSKSMKDKRE